METITEQPIKKFEFFRCPQSLPSIVPLTKKPEESVFEIEKYPEEERVWLSNIGKKYFPEP